MKQTMWKSRLILTIALLAVMPIGSTDNTVDHTRESKKSLDVVIAADPDSVSVGGVVKLTLTVTNGTNQTIDFGSGSSSCWFDVRVRAEESGQEIALPRACTNDLSHRFLKPGKKKIEIVLWYCQMFEGDRLYDVPAGTYEIWGIAGDVTGPSIKVVVSN